MPNRSLFHRTPRRVSDQVATFLRGEIYTGTLKPGERLLEVELGNQLEVSRAPIREALLILQRDGLVSMRPHRGATVAMFTDDDILEIYELRRLLDPVAARAAAQRHDPAAAATLREQLDRMELAVERRDAFQAALAHADFHKALGRASGMPRVASFIDSLCTQMLASHARGSVEHPEEIAVLITDHSPIVDAVEQGHPDIAAAATTAHFRPVDPMMESYRRLRQQGADTSESESDVDGDASSR
jgi:DNA-binding GntR family transcriptional regulator